MTTTDPYDDADTPETVALLQRSRFLRGVLAVGRVAAIVGIGALIAAAVLAGVGVVGLLLVEWLTTVGVL